MAVDDYAENWASLLELFVSVRMVLVSASQQLALDAVPAGSSYLTAPLPVCVRAQNAGLKLRLAVLDTVLVKGGRIIGHFYTDRDGVVCKVAAHIVTKQSVYKRIAHQHQLDPHTNPFGYMAVAHYPSGVSRLLKRPEFQELVGVGCAVPRLRDAPACTHGDRVPHNTAHPSRAWS